MQVACHLMQLAACLSRARLTLLMLPMLLSLLLRLLLTNASGDMLAVAQTIRTAWHAAH